MKKSLFLLAVAAIASFAAAQQPDAASLRYQAYRTAITVPSYGLAKVQALVAKIKEDQEMNRRLPEKQFKGLTLEQKFTYVMIHGEDFTQNCNEMGVVAGDAHKIFAHPADGFNDEALWSDRQRAFLHDHRAKVIELLRATIDRKHRVGVNLKAAITEIAAVELVPDIIAVYRRDRKDQDILSVVLSLMKDAKFKPFTASPMYAKLYGDDRNWQTSVEANLATENRIIDWGLAFSKSKKK